MGRIEGQWVIHRVSSFQIWIEKSLKWDGVRPQGTVARNTVRCTTVGHKSWYISLAAFDIWQGRKKYCFQLCNFEKNLKKIKKAKMPELDDAFPCALLNTEMRSFLFSHSSFSCFIFERHGSVLSHNISLGSCLLLVALAPCCWPSFCRCGLHVVLPNTSLCISQNWNEYCLKTCRQLWNSDQFILQTCLPCYLSISL